MGIPYIHISPSHHIPLSIYREREIGRGRYVDIGEYIWTECERNVEREIGGYRWR